MILALPHDYHVILLLYHMTELYVDEKKQTYQSLGFRRFNWVSIWKALLNRISRSAASEVRVKGHLQAPSMLLGLVRRPLQTGFGIETSADWVW